MDLSFWWVLPARRGAALGQPVLRSLSTVPEARPRLIGSYEPVRMPLPPDDDAPFLALWREEMVDGGMFIWKANKPFRDGWVSFPNRYDETWDGLRGREKAVTLTVRVRSSGYRDAAGRESLVKFFANVASRLGAVYAAGGLEGEDQFEAEAGDLDGDVLVHGVWVGIPPLRAWLQWFGGPYVAELSDLPTVVKSGRGLLLRRGEEPAMRGSLPGPPIPTRLCWRAETAEEWQGRSLLTVSNRVPAEDIPVIRSSPYGRRPQRAPAAVQRSPGTESAGASPRLVWKDEAGPGWPGGGHPQREGPAWMKTADGSLEELNEGAWMTRAAAQDRAEREGYAFEEV
jgi:hypothetical protein